jgi:4-aminobutyrate aminotransferase-like enzyme
MPRLQFDQPRAQERPHCFDVRGHGLFLGIEWVESRETKAPDRQGAAAVVNALREKGFLIGSAGAYGNVVKIRPPLVFSRANAEAFLAAFEETLDELG